MRADRGTENTNIAFLQPFLRDDGNDNFAKEKSFMYGRSTSNQVIKDIQTHFRFSVNVLQRIEAWWGQLRKNAAGWWMEYFKVGT